MEAERPVPRAAPPDARPIAIGNVLRRAFWTHMMTSFSEVVGQSLAPVQLAIGVAGGIQILYTGIRIACTCSLDDTTSW